MAPPARPVPISSLIADDGRDRDLVYRLRTIGLHYHALVNARFLCHHEASWQAEHCFLFRRSGNRGISYEAHVCSLGDRHRCLRSEEHTYELQSLMRKSYAGFCLKHKIK